MPLVDQLERKIHEFGYTLSNSVNAEQTLFGHITGGEFGTIRATLRATDTSCNLGLFVGILDAVREPDRYSLIINLLELNYSHVFGRIAAFRASDKNTKVPAYVIIVAETTFFWTELTKLKLDHRAASLKALTLAASQLLASKDGLLPTNPFYKSIPHSAPPLSRDKFPTDQSD